MYPPVWMIPRMSVLKDEIAGFSIKKKSTVCINVHALQRNPKYWDNPNGFYPERFLYSKLKHKCSFVPFSTGKQICVGNKLGLIQIMLTTAFIVNNFDTLEYRYKIYKFLSLYEYVYLNLQIL